MARTAASLSDIVEYKRRSAEPPGASSVLLRAHSNTPVVRLPGMALVFSESPAAVPEAFPLLVASWGVHERTVFVTVRQVGLLGSGREGWALTHGARPGQGQVPCSGLASSGHQEQLSWLAWSPTPPPGMHLTACGACGMHPR